MAFIRHALTPEAGGKLNLHQDVLSYYKQYPNHIVVHVPYLSTPQDLERFSSSVRGDELEEKSIMYPKRSEHTSRHSFHQAES